MPSLLLTSVTQYQRVEVHSACGQFPMREAITSIHEVNITDNHNNNELTARLAHSLRQGHRLFSSNRFNYSCTCYVRIDFYIGHFRKSVFILYLYYLNSDFPSYIS